MRKLLSVLLCCLLVPGMLGCSKEEMVTQQEFMAAETELLQKIDALQQELSRVTWESEKLRQEADTLRQELDALTAEVPFDGDYTQFFNYILIDGKYSALSIKQDAEIPEVLVVPNRYQDTEVAYTGASLLDGVAVKTIIFEAGVECSYFLCGCGNNCPTLEKIVILSEDPYDCLFTKLRHPEKCDVMLQLNDAQINGGCLIYVPDEAVETYLDTIWMEYRKLIRPISELDAETLAYIQ